MRKQTYTVAKNGLEVDISVVVLPGQAGGDLANVNRWRNQLQLEAWSEKELNSRAERLKVSGENILVVDFASKENLIQGKYKKRMIAAVLWIDGKSWFFKMVGEDKLVVGEKPHMMSLLRSIQK